MAEFPIANVESKLTHIRALLDQYQCAHPDAEDVRMNEYAWERTSAHLDNVLTWLQIATTDGWMRRERTMTSDPDTRRVYRRFVDTDRPCSRCGGVRPVYEYRRGSKYSPGVYCSDHCHDAA